MGRCKDCRWWGVAWEGVCDFMGTITHSKIDPILEFDIHIEALDDQGLDVTLRTGRLFGCVHFSEKGK